MPYKDPEKHREVCRKYQERQRKSKEHREKSAKYYQDNKKDRNNYGKLYRQSEKGKKATMKKVWKQRGLDMATFEEVYERYTLAIFCDICECVLNEEGNHNSKKCMDHSHITGEFRNVICHCCNLKLPKYT
jgi:hypothetical protein